MRHGKGNPLLAWGVGLIVLAIGIQVVWSILLQLKYALFVGLLLICIYLAIRWVRRYRGHDDDLLIR